MTDKTADKTIRGSVQIPIESAQINDVDDYDWPAHFASLPSAEIISVDTLAEHMKTLEKKGFGGFRPARWRYIQALYKKAAKLRPERARPPLQQAVQALIQLLDELRGRLPQVLAKAAELSERQPLLVKQCERLLARSDFDALERLANRVGRSQGRPLAALVTSLNQALAIEPEYNTDSTLANTLRSQESELVAAHIQNLPGQYGQQHTESHRELRSVCAYRESIRRLGANQLVARTIAEAPPESGPLNPQMLATQTLARMQQLSSACSVHYVNYLQTLLLLDSLPSKYEPS